MFISIGYRSILGPILGATIGGIAAVILLHIIQPQKEIKSFTPVDYRISIIITCLYVVSIIILYRFALYERPISHYLVFGGFAGFIAYEIATGARKARIVPQVLVLTFFTYWSTQLAFPAGMFQPDTRAGYLPVIRDGLANGVIDGDIAYLGHLIYVTETIQITGLSPRIGYFLIATLLLSSTLVIISVLDEYLFSLSDRTPLYGALFFGCMGWTLGRGLHPGKLSFFYALTLLLGIVVINQYYKFSGRERQRWAIIGLIIAPALIYGHRFSSGAALLFAATIAGFILLYPVLPSSAQMNHNYTPAIAFVSAYAIFIFGIVHSGALLSRVTGLVSSIFFPAATGGGSGGPGRYSELSIDLLLVSTGGEAILFGFGVLGAAIVLRRERWEYDLMIFWIGMLSVFLVTSLVFNAADTQPQRFYALLGVFGLNILSGIAIVYLLQSNIKFFSPRIVGTVIFAFAVLTLASPVAGIHLSIISDDVPHSRYYNTNQLTVGDHWVNTYEGSSETMLQTMPPETELPYKSDSGVTALVDTSQIEPGTRYMYTDTAADTGIFNSGGLGLGDRTLVFLELAPQPKDSVIYSNGDTSVYVKETN